MNSNYLRSLRIVYFALAMGIVFFMLVTLLLIKVSGPFAQADITASEKTPFLIVLIVITVSIFIAYKVIFPRKQDAIKALPTLEKKLLAWRELCVLQGALIEAPAFFALVLFLLLGIYTLLVWPLAGLLLFWITQPTRDKLIMEASLTPSETAEFDTME